MRAIHPLLATAILAAPAAADPRVRTVVYAADDVVQLTGHYGYQMLIALEPAERIENISIGDSVAWLVIPNRTGNGLFLKPVEPDAATNMTVQTDRRTYLFELKAARAARGGASPGMIYKLAFRYPAAERPASPPAPVVRNRAYTLSGAKALRPSAVFDDGRSTYFQWPAGRAIPAIFVADDGEALVNHATRGGYVVVDRVARRFVLRSGRDKLRVTNKGVSAAGGAP